MTDTAVKYEKWIKRITAAEKKYEDYHKLVDEIRTFYKNDRNKNRSNIFWSSIETLKPFLYFKQPKAYVDRKSKLPNPVENVASIILEKALEWDLGQFDIDSVIKYARNDYLLSGMGLLYEKYKPTFKKIEQTVSEVDENGATVVKTVQAEVLDSAYIETRYIDPKDFIADSEKVGIWEDCTWVARIIHMTKQDVIDQFEIDEDLLNDDDAEEKNTKVYEIWDKSSGSVIYLSQDFKNNLLKEDALPSVNGVFPMPKPIMTTCTNDSIIPVPDYSEIKALLDELNGVVDRMRLITQALKISGCYDSSYPELARILEKDVTLVSIADYDRLKEAGGINGIVDFMEIRQYVEALQALAQRKTEILQNIYEVTGISDIMRGNTDKVETATAINQKTNFGTLRNQDRQNDMQRFICDLLRIKAEMICEMFEPETLAQFAQNQDEATVAQAISLLKTEKVRNLYIGIETDTSFTQDQEQQKAVEAVKLINEMITSSFEAISSQPLLLPLYKQMMESVIITLPSARQFEPIIDDVFKKISEQLNAPQKEQPNPEVIKATAEQQKVQNDFAIKQEQNQIKRDELNLKKQTEDNKIAMTRMEAEMQYDLEQQKINQGEQANSNITTGYVKAF